MGDRMNRRGFLTLAAAGCASCLAGRAGAGKPAPRALRRAVITGKLGREDLLRIRDAGFDGVEANTVLPLPEAAEARKAAEEIGLRIHSLLPGAWARLNSDRPEEVEASVQHLSSALKAAQAYGADALLLVPGRVDVGPMPQPWEFRVAFDPASGKLTQVAAEGNERFQAYIEAHGRAQDAFREGIRRLVPLAETTQVVLAVENVWNNLFVDPTHFAHFIDSFQSPWVRAYLDLGNHVKYSPTERWISALGKRIARCHVKDFRLSPDGHGGQFVDIGDGSVNWPVVRKALDDVGYLGWATIEGSGGLPLAEQRARVDRLLPAL